MPGTHYLQIQTDDELEAVRAVVDDPALAHRLATARARLRPGAPVLGGGRTIDRHRPGGPRLRPDHLVGRSHHDAGNRRRGVASHPLAWTGCTCSIVITAWNAEQFIGEALASVMAQTRPVHQIVVNDDGSTDGTAAAVEAMPGPIELLRSPHEGISEGRDRGLARATGDVVAFLDADDLWLPEKLARQCQVLTDHPEVDTVYTRTNKFDDEPTASHRSPSAGGRDRW